MVDVERYLKRNHTTVRDIMPTGTHRPIMPPDLHYFTLKAVCRSPSLALHEV
jgi:hypothetical protein